ncbi:hypothetical protein F0P96_09320 [Hymenobacter busanensis]|uniref:Uncharacterized protein n=1 Tax=Hymenobacter busanensis TaxID=2607656 RepID=A0A7L4ZZF0_9BACT|nr:hypothetical protein [Hymenobacter busanensis]KAA9333169.1 hypothetical protein F0P96_09320 [Hymenobacter busanensis]QHJ08155.1 hypothetical protein GUY19_13005 [Hymenobacter busanensis]
MLLIVGTGRSQTNAKRLDSDYAYWSATRRLQLSDFGLQVKPGNYLNGSNAMFGFEMHGNVYDLFGKQANNVIRNRMLRTASWVDTTSRTDVAAQIRFHQTLFDIQEVYCRRLRQQIRASATKILLFGKPDINELFNEQMKDSQQRQALYVNETNYGTLSVEQATWEKQIMLELQNLQAFQASE